MANLEEWSKQYIEETGDNPPRKPKRLYVRKPNEYTSAGQRWVEASELWDIRFLSWMLGWLQGGHGLRRAAETGRDPTETPPPAHRS